jgi:sulfatase-modifying factor enzyme 1
VRFKPYVAQVLVTVGVVGLVGLSVSLSHGDEQGRAEATSPKRMAAAATLSDAADAAPCAATSPASACPADMVNVKDRFCIDRYEGSITDETGRVASPYYPPDGPSAVKQWMHWSAVSTWEQWAASGRIDAGDGGGFLFVEQPEAGTCPGGALDTDSGSCWEPRVLVAVPPLPPWQQSGGYDYRAISKQGVEPSGYMSGLTSAHACRAAGKRLCTESEWVTACRGERGTRQPYGDRFRDGICNIHREAHPSLVLRGDWGAKLTDPRLNLMHHQGAPLLRKTGASPGCASRWGDDAVYDMVGNLDEWVDNRAGLFLGGFYARATHRGCMARVWAHPVSHVDFSTGFRCCRDVQFTEN